MLSPPHQEKKHRDPLALAGSVARSSSRRWCHGVVLGKMGCKFGALGPPVLYLYMHSICMCTLMAALRTGSRDLPPTSHAVPVTQSWVRDYKYTGLRGPWSWLF